jgi:hypothetical protein
MTVIVFTALVWKVVDFLRMLFNYKTQRSGIVTQLTAWVGGIVLVVAAAHASIAKNLVLPGSTNAISTVDFASQVLLGLLIASVASTAVDIKQAVDNTDTASKPAIVSTPIANDKAAV